MSTKPTKGSSHLASLVSGAVNAAKNAPTAGTTGTAGSGAAQAMALGSKPASKSGMSAPGSLAIFSSEHEAMRKELAALKSEQGAAFDVDISALRPSPYQHRPIVQDKVIQLAANLASNPLNSPIAVRLIADTSPQLYEIVSGHHRQAAFIVNGKSKIPAIIRQLTDDEARRLVFYDNLLGPELTDFDRFTGFNEIRTATGATYEHLALDSGVSVSTVKKLFIFMKLTPAALDAVRTNPAPFTAYLLNRLLTSKFQGVQPSDALIEECIEKLASGEIDGSLVAAQAWLRAKMLAATPRPATVTHKIQSGRSVFASLAVRAGKMVIDFQDPDQAAALTDRILALLEEAKSSDA